MNMEKTMMPIKNQAGYILIELLIVSTVLIVLLSSVILHVPNYMASKRELTQTSIRLIEDLRQLQQSTIYGYEKETLSLTTLMIEPDGYMWRNNNRIIRDKFYFPENIYCRMTSVSITFQTDGRPYEDTVIALVHKKTQARILIYIAAQTGRIRWQLYEN